MSILKSLGNAVKKTVKKVAAPVKKIAKSELGKQALGPVNSALLSGGSPSDMLKGIQANYQDMANNPFVRAAAMSQTGFDPAMINSMTGGPTPSNDILSKAVNMYGGATGASPSFGIGDFTSVFNPQANPQVGSQSPNFGQFNMGDINGHLPSSKGIWDSLKDFFNAKDVVGSPNSTPQVPSGASMGDLRKFENQDYYKDQMQLDSQGQDVTNVPWYKKLSSGVGSAAYSVGDFIKANPGVIGTGTNLLGMGAGYLSTRQGYNDYIRALEDAQNIDLHQMGASNLEALTSSPEYNLLRQYQEAGVTPQDELAMEQERRNILANRQAQDAALKEELNRRGQLGSGAEIASRLGGQQQDVSDARMNMLQRNAQRQANRLNAAAQGLGVRQNIAQAQDIRQVGNTEIQNAQTVARQQAKQGVGGARLNKGLATGKFLKTLGGVVDQAINPQQTQQKTPIDQLNQYGTEEERKKRLLGQ